jgi:hypothetical protein
MMLLSRDKIQAVQQMAIIGATGRGWGIGRHTLQWLKKNGYATHEAYGKKWKTLRATDKGVNLFEALHKQGAFEYMGFGRRIVSKYQTRRAMRVEV